jgi:hypothetical protein
LLSALAGYIFLNMLESGEKELEKEEKNEF